MSIQLQVFNSSEFGTIGIMCRDGKDYFPATDCARMLGYINPRDAIIKHCKGVVKYDVLTDGGEQSINYIPEGDLFRLIIKSNLPAADKFERWIFDEVLPSIHHTGGYIAGQESMTDDELMAKALEVAQRKIAERENRIKELTPAAEFGNAVSNNAGGILIRDYVKILQNDGISIGQDRFFSWLHLNRYIYRQSGYKPQWIPYRQYIDQGLFRIKETPVSTSKGGDWISITIRVLGKGQKYFYEKLKREAS